MAIKGCVQHCAIVDGAATVRDLNFKSMAAGKGAKVTARFGADGVTICDPNRAREDAATVFQRIYDKAIQAVASAVNPLTPE